MLAYQKLPDVSKLQYPLYALPKLDGVRALVKGSKILSRKLLPIPNRFVRAKFSSSKYEGLDGELILGDPTSPTVFRDTSRALRTEEGEPDVQFHVFDQWSSSLPYADRARDLYRSELSFETVERRLIHSVEHLLQYEEEKLDLGYEGLILRYLEAPYKFGRSTLKEGGMIKLKRFVDAEATIVDFEEELHNANEAKRDKLGRTKRSSHQENMIGKGVLGAFVCTSPDFPGHRFEVGVGLTDKDSKTFWEHRPELLGKVLKYKHFPKGGKDKPRHAVFLGLRDAWDL